MGAAVFGEHPSVSFHPYDLIRCAFGDAFRIGLPGPCAACGAETYWTDRDGAHVCSEECMERRWVRERVVAFAVEIEAAEIEKLERDIERAKRLLGKDAG